MPPRRPTVRVAVPAPPRTMALPRSFFVLTETRVLPAMMSFKTLLMSALVEILHAARPKQRDDVPLDAPGVRDNCRRLFRAPALPEDKTCVEVVEIEGAKLFDRDGVMIKLAFFSGIVALGNATQLHLRLLPRSSRRPDAMQADRVAARAAQARY